MRRAQLLLLCLSTLLTLAAGPGAIQVAGSNGGQGIEQPNPIVFQSWGGLKGTDWSTGATIQADANVVSHATWNGTAISDTKVTWTQNGTVPQVTTSPFYPTGFANAARNGAGPFTGVNFYNLPGTSALDFTGDFTVYIAFTETSLTGTKFAGDGTFNTSGIEFGDGGGSGPASVRQDTSGSNATATTANNIAMNGVNIMAAGVSGTTLHVSLNGGADATATTVARTAGSGFKLGGGSMPGVIYEFYATTTAYSAATAKQIEMAYLGETGTAGEQWSITQATQTTETLPTPGATTCATPGGCIFFWPTGTVRVSNEGATIEGQVSNLIQRSSDLANAAWTATLVTATDNVTDIFGRANQATTLADTLAGGKVESTTTSAAAAKYTASVWAKTSSGTQSWDLRIRDTTGQSDLVACNGKSATTTWTRFSCSSGTATAGHAIAIDIYPGGSGGSGTIIASDAQLESGPTASGTFMSSYIETTSAAVTRNADQDSLTEALTWGVTTLTLQDYSISMKAAVENDDASLLADSTGILGSNQNYVPLLRTSTGAGAAGAFFSDSPATGITCGGTIANPRAVNTYTAKRQIGKGYCATGSGFGTGVTLGAQPSEPTSFQLGFDNANGAAFSGYISNLCFARDAFSCVPASP